MNKEFSLKKGEYLNLAGVQVMAFSDYYPAGHQSGISIIMHGKRIATNGDVRFEPTPGQWQPVPKKKERVVDTKAQSITTTLSYPDYDAHLKGFNPIIYPDFEFNYNVTLKPAGKSVIVTVDLDREIPERYAGKLCFNLELYSGELFGKHWLMDDKQGIFPRHPNGPVFERESNIKNAGHFENVDEWVSVEQLTKGSNEYSPIVADDILGEPYAIGKHFTSCPEDKLLRLSVECQDGELRLYDGRVNHNNGWFTISQEMPLGKTREAIKWIITPNCDDEWLYSPVVQVSQLGYHPSQSKVAVVEVDARDNKNYQISLIKYSADGEKVVASEPAKNWGEFLRYRYLQFDFSNINEPGLYQVVCGDSKSAVFQISENVYDRGVWQPVLEYFLPVQMCHMMVKEKYRVWHGHCHKDDARMAPTNRGHFDGYRQGLLTLTKYKSGEIVPGLNVGGWHDAGDYDLRIESQSGECYNLALAYEMFNVNYDATTINQAAHMVEIHRPDGENDILQQIEHGALTVLGGYRALGRMYRGIICNDLRQYVLLGDAATMTDGLPSEDDRWVFTEENPSKDFQTAAHMAAVSRALNGFRDKLSEEALEAAINLYEYTEADDNNKWCRNSRIHAAAELFITTEADKYKKDLLASWDIIVENYKELGWIGARVVDLLDDLDAGNKLREAMLAYKKELDEESLENPYGVPYKPFLYGAGWNIQGMAFRYYFIKKAYPDIFDNEFLFKALNFILGCHPGLNTASFASGVGAKSMTTAYGINRADWSYIPGGVVSGTALIQPDFPELLDYPFLWQQAEYVMGGGSSNYMFLVLAVIDALGRN